MKTGKDFFQNFFFFLCKSLDWWLFLFALSKNNPIYFQNVLLHETLVGPDFGAYVGHSTTGPFIHVKTH